MRDLGRHLPGQLHDALRGVVAPLATAQGGRALAEHLPEAIRGPDDQGGTTVLPVWR